MCKITTREITIRRPDDFHVHFRDDAMLHGVVPATARHFARALVMPNLLPPITTSKMAQDYRERILAALPEGSSFTPLMTLYLTDNSDAHDIIAGAKDGLVQAVKLYPAGVTTNSNAGVTNITKVMPILEAMAKAGIRLCVHGEVTKSDVDIFDREARFIEEVLDPLCQRLPELTVTLEHVTTKEGIDYVKGAKQNLYASLTMHHLMINRNHMLAGGIRPHYYCLPILKRETHQRALVEAAISGDSRFFLGTDSAPHPDSGKLNPCGCAGCYTAPITLSCLAQLFEEEGALDKLEAFTSVHGAKSYGLPLNEGKITLTKEEEPINYESHITVGEDTLSLFDPGRPLFWRVFD